MLRCAKPLKLACLMMPRELYPLCLQASNFLWPFKLSSPKGGFINKRSDLTDAMLQQTLLRTVVGMLAEVTAFAKHAEVTGEIGRTAFVLTSDGAGREAA